MNDNTPTANSDDVAAYYHEKVDRVYRDDENDRARSPHRLSASLVGGCLRQAAYRLAGTPVDDRELPPPHRAATNGTALHEYFLPKLAAVCGPSADYEQEVVARMAGIDFTSRYDLYDPHLPHGPAVVDKKTVGPFMWRRVTDGYRPREHRIQNYVYALGNVQKGRTVDWVVWIYLNRDTGEDFCVAEPFDYRRAAAAIDRIAEIVTASTNPDTARREAPGPSAMLRGRSWSPCDGCEWMVRCWGNPRPGVAAQAKLAEEGDAATYVRGHYEASQVAKEATEQKEFMRSVLTGVEPGVYDGIKLSKDKRGAIRTRPAATDEGTPE